MTGAGDAIVTVRPSPVRLWLAVASLCGIAFLLASVAIGSTPAPFWRAAFLVSALAAAAMAFRLARTAGERIVLTEAGLFTGSGERIADIRHIRSVDRGAFAFKPSSGFLVRLDRAVGSRWVPGLWWRLGRFVGVGGVAPGAQTRAMAEILTVMLARRS